MQTNRLKLDPERTGFEGWNFCRGLDYCKDMVRSCNNTFTSDLYAQLYMFGIMFPDMTDVSMTFVCLCEGVQVWVYLYLQSFVAQVYLQICNFPTSTETIKVDTEI